VAEGQHSDQNHDDNSLLVILSRLMSRRSRQRIRFGGVVGKVTYISLAAILAAAGASAYTPIAGWQRFAPLVVLPVFALIVIKWILGYADKHPQSATLEGAEIIEWHQQVVAAAAKTLKPPRNSPIVPAPGNSPLLNPPPDEQEE
jgi:hypothetical protein